jgi:hypothetical protein
MIETHKFGSRTVDVVEQVDDEDVSYSIVVDCRLIREAPLPARPSFEDVVRLYAQSRERAADNGTADC